MIAEMRRKCATAPCSVQLSSNFGSFAPSEALRRVHACGAWTLSLRLLRDLNLHVKVELHCGLLAAYGCRKEAVLADGFEDVRIHIRAGRTEDLHIGWIALVIDDHGNSRGAHIAAKGRNADTGLVDGYGVNQLWRYDSA